jgi:hypothetical protein
MPAGAKVQLQTSARTEGGDGGHVPGTDWPSKGNFSFSSGSSLCVGNAATPLASQVALLVASNTAYDYSRLFDLLMRAGSNGKRGRTGAVYYSARTVTFGDGGTSAPRAWCLTAVLPSASRSRL